MRHASEWIFYFKQKHKKKLKYNSLCWLNTSERSITLSERDNMQMLSTRIEFVRSVCEPEWVCLSEWVSLWHSNTNAAHSPDDLLFKPNGTERSKRTNGLRLFVWLTVRVSGDETHKKKVVKPQIALTSYIAHIIVYTPTSENMPAQFPPRHRQFWRVVVDERPRNAIFRHTKSKIVIREDKKTTTLATVSLHLTFSWFVLFF